MYVPRTKEGLTHIFSELHTLPSSTPLLVAKYLMCVALVLLPTYSHTKRKLESGRIRLASLQATARNWI